MPPYGGGRFFHVVWSGSLKLGSGMCLSEKLVEVSNSELCPSCLPHLFGFVYQLSLALRMCLDLYSLSPACKWFSRHLPQFPKQTMLMVWWFFFLWLLFVLFMSKLWEFGLSLPSSHMRAHYWQFDLNLWLSIYLILSYYIGPDCIFFFPHLF